MLIREHTSAGLLGLGCQMAFYLWEEIRVGLGVVLLLPLWDVASRTVMTRAVREYRLVHVTNQVSRELFEHVAVVDPASRSQWRALKLKLVIPIHRRIVALTARLEYWAQTFKRVLHATSNDANQFQCAVLDLASQ